MKSILHRLLLGLFTSVCCWFVIDLFIIEIGFFRYLLVELLVMSGHKLYLYLSQKYLDKSPKG